MKERCYTRNLLLQGVKNEFTIILELLLKISTKLNYFRCHKLSSTMGSLFNADIENKTEIFNSALYEQFPSCKFLVIKLTCYKLYEAAQFWNNKICVCPSLKFDNKWLHTISWFVYVYTFNLEMKPMSDNFLINKCAHEKFFPFLHHSL